MNETMWNETNEIMEPTALAEREPFPTEHALLLGKYLTALLWIMLASVLAGLVTNRTGGVLNAVKLLAQCLATGWVLLQLSPVHSGYRLAGILEISQGVIGFVTELIPTDRSSAGLLILLLLPSLVLSFITLYQEYNAHADVMESVDGAFADKWRALWKWTVGLLIGLFVGLLLMLLSAGFGLLMLLLDAIGLVVTVVLYAVYLWRMAKHFRLEEVQEGVSNEITL